MLNYILHHCSCMSEPCIKKSMQLHCKFCNNFEGDIVKRYLHWLCATCYFACCCMEKSATGSSLNHKTPSSLSRNHTNLKRLMFVCMYRKKYSKNYGAVPVLLRQLVKSIYRVKVTELNSPVACELMGRLNYQK